MNIAYVFKSHALTKGHYFQTKTNQKPFVSEKSISDLNVVNRIIKIIQRSM
jgi:hypothetical protein